MVLDDPSSHESPRAAQALRARGAWFLLLPACSPDPNPVEMASSKLEALLRRIGARTIDDLRRAVGSICGLHDEQECRNHFVAMGYAHERR